MTRPNRVFVKNQYMLKLYNTYTFLLLCFSTSLMLAQAPSRNTFKAHSVLSDGQIFKLAVTESGLYKIGLSEIREMGITTNIDPESISIWSNRGGMMPEPLSAERVDDLEQIPVYWSGNDNSNWENDEYIILYAEGADLMSFDPSINKYKKDKNIYDQTSYIFLKIGDDKRLDISSTSSPGSADVSHSTFTDAQFWEEDRYNLLGLYSSTIGSGKKWYGEIFSNVRTQDYTAFFDFNNTVPGSAINVEAEFANRSNRSSTARVVLNGEAAQKTVSAVDVTSSISTYARIAGVDLMTTAPTTSPLRQSDFNLQLEVNGNGSIFESWLDHIAIELQKELIYKNQPLYFQNKDLDPSEITEFLISKENDAQLEVWNITNAITTTSIIPSSQSSQSVSIRVNADPADRFVAFDPEADYPAPAFVEEITNQDLHAIDDAELIIVYHPEFRAAAERLADHRRSFSNLIVVTTSVQEIYNEFSGGRQDPVAIRNFAKMIFDRSDNFRYLCLFGDGSYDFRGLDENLPFSSFVPVYETEESLDPIEAFPTDDFYALLNDNEGGDLVGAIDIAVGRIPVMTGTEAEQVVDKIIRYDNSLEAMGDWRNRIAFVADDEDSNQHLNQSIQLGNRIESMYPEFNQEKIFFDAFPQVATVGDERYPDAKKAINNNMFKGLLVINYFGHGGPKGWAQERVLELNDINSWTNQNKYPLFVTATCTFTGYDDPEARSGGELTFINPNGGSIGLVTTVRAVYSNSNRTLTFAFFDRLFDKEQDGSRLSVGQILMNAKNANSQDTLRSNARKFTLIGDPSLQLSLPEYRVRTTEINENSINEGIDTIGALQIVTVSGYIAGEEDQDTISSFNGTLIPTVFDKRKELFTLGQDDRSFVKKFEVQNNVLFKGNTEVKDGRFKFTFVVPKDIDYRYGYGKISYYAFDESNNDATGLFEDIVIGGSSDNVSLDDIGPEITLFMNDENFVDGGVTGPDPILLVKLYDDFGINVTGNSIGHDLTGILDGDTQNSFIMNDYYESEPGDFRRGVVRYPLNDLEPGMHTIKVRAWDISNNLAEAEISFEVIGHENPVLINTLTFPNPFIDRVYFQFEHNLAGKDLQLELEIFDALGRTIRIIEQELRPSTYTYRDLYWDGTDSRGTRVQAGLYFYRIGIKYFDMDGSSYSSNASSGSIMVGQ
jgi:hypothetical protein